MTVASDRFTQHRSLALWAGMLMLLCVGGAWLEFRNISSTMPYPQHIDEPAISGNALHILTSGSLHPGDFGYPSLPTYIAAGALAVGFVRAAPHLEMNRVDQIGRVGFPHYEKRRPMQTARRCFVLISLLALAMTAACAWFITERPIVIFLAPLFTLASPLFFYQSWAYLNVNIVGACCVMMTLAASLNGMRRPSMYWSALLPGALAGLAMGSKYTLMFAILPVLLGIWCAPPPLRRLWGSAIAAVSMVVAFLIVAPFTVIDLPGFLNGVAGISYRYAQDNSGFDGSGGLPPLLFYLRHFVDDFGMPAVLLAVVGGFVAVVHDPRRAAILLAFPAALLWLLSSQRMHFVRNVVAVHGVVGVLASVGLVALAGWLVGLIQSVRGVQPATQPLMRAAVLTALIFVALPLSNVTGLFQDRTDSRVAAQSWLAARMAGFTIVTPRELGFDVGALKASGLRVELVDLALVRTSVAADALAARVTPPAVILVPRWGFDSYQPGDSTQASDLNDVARRWRPLRSFGTHDALVNLDPNPMGDLAFTVSAFNLPEADIARLMSTVNGRAK